MPAAISQPAVVRQSTTFSTDNATSGDADLVRRLLDLAVASIAIVLLLPVMAVMALLIWLTDWHSPIFAQQRVGRGGQMFACLKFRTMVYDCARVLAEHLDRNHVYSRSKSVRFNLIIMSRTVPSVLLRRGSY
ncbi:lipopolysaccharide/colanic/teichoic acid biosynthesis glycosyltransferase [Sphingomonas sp. BK069]|nr:lipopolysaccharide/colanic/teichoic acid biosynthesis glycosyltransferase [Sphingomonas sp. BK069]